jgi:hypothetical protein
MKKIYYFSAVVSVMAIFILQSCYTTGQKSVGVSDEKVLSGEKTSGNNKISEVKETSVTTLMLGDKHKDAGVECKGCHLEEPPAKEVPTSVCLTCHDDFAKIASQDPTDEINPHNSHMAFQECGDCHHSHEQSQDQCKACHSFDFKIP